MKARNRIACIALTTTSLVVVMGAPASAAGQYPTIDPTFSQELYGTATAFFGGVAFAPDGSPLVDECAFSGSPLHKFDATTLLPTTNGTTTLHPASTLPSAAGCGLTNHPDGTLYSNTGAGVTNLNATTGALIRTIGVAGNALGITVDPQTNKLVYVGSDCRFTATCTIWSTDPVSLTTSAFAVLSSTDAQFVDGIAFDPTGNFLFMSNRAPSFRVTILNRTGAIVQHVALPREPDGIAYHVTGARFVLVNDNSGALDRLDFPLNNYALPPTISTLASGGFRGDLSQVGPDNCMYVTQNGTRYDNGTTTGDDSLVRVCPGFAPPPGVGDLTGRAIALHVQSAVASQDFGDTGYVSTGTATYVTNSAESVTAGPTLPVTASVLNGTVITYVSGPRRSYAEASVASVVVAVGPGVQASGVVAKSTTNCGGSTGETDIASLTIAGVPVNVNVIPPNTVIPLVGGGSVTLNEQIATSTATSRVLTVNAIHVQAPGQVDVVVSSATSDIHRC